MVDRLLQGNADIDLQGKVSRDHLFVVGCRFFAWFSLRRSLRSGQSLKKRNSSSSFEIANKSLSDFGGFLPKDYGIWNFGKKKVKIKTKTKVTDPSIRSIPDIFYYKQSRKVASNNVNVPIHAISPTYVLSINKLSSKKNVHHKKTQRDKRQETRNHRILLKK